jgi:hypothetical protein
MRESTWAWVTGIVIAGGIAALFAMSAAPTSKPVDVRTACARQFSSTWDIDECAKKLVRRQRDEAVAKGNAELRRNEMNESRDRRDRLDRAYEETN